MAVTACDDDVLPLQDRIETVTDEAELDEVYETERHLFYVACTRARDRLLVSGVEPASEFFADLKFFCALADEGLKGVFRLMVTRKKEGALTAHEKKIV